MAQKKLILNLSMIGNKSTGLGVYALNVKDILLKKFQMEIIASIPLENKKIIFSPKYITLGYSRYANMSRLFYSMFLKPSNTDFVYTPTHHGFIGHPEQVITIHDLICIHYPDQHKKQYWYFKYILPKIIKSCKAIFTVSNTAKMDICKYYKLSADFVHIIPNAIPGKKHIINQNQIKDEKYLLVVGANYPHKNIHELIENNKLWKNDYKLKIVSEGGAYGTYLKKIVHQNNLEKNVDFLGFVSEEKLDQLYGGCVALIYPSLWEGFGIPPLEALSYNKPIILSHIPVLQEVFEDAGIYIKIKDYYSWEIAFKILNDQNVLKDKLIKSKKILNKYNWESNGEKIKNILIELDPKLKDALKNEH